MATFEITSTLELPSIPTSGPLESILPLTARATEAGAQAAQAHWLSFATGEVPLPDGRTIKMRTGDYARSIQMQQQGAFSWRVYSDDPSAGSIEEGSPAYDMKRALQTSPKVRIGKKGQRYLVIPFRHGTPGTVGFHSVMPDHVHEAARQLAASRITGIRMEVNKIGVHDISTRSPVMVQRLTYSWGGKLPAGMVSKRKPNHATDPFAGMSRFDAPNKGHSQFMTFRTMSERSAGWIRPAVPGYWPARTTAEELSVKIQAMIAEAFQEDIRRLIPAATAAS